MNLELLAPELSLAATAVVLILLDLFIERKGVLVVLSIIGLVVSAVFAIALWGTSEAAFNGMLSVDNFALFFKLLFLGIAALVILASVDYAPKFSRFQGEYYALIVLSALGMMLMAASSELITIYIALELASISLYVLAGFLKDPKSTESSIKYLLLGATSSAVLLYGMALVFGSTGTTQLAEISQAVQNLGATGVGDNPALMLGAVLLIAGFGFKIAAVPFQMWVPDVYEGAPTPITGYLSVASKAAGFAIILRVFFSAFGTPEWLSMNWGLVFAALAAIGMTVGNISALPQINIKRMFGYSSIAQAGYLLVGLAAMGVGAATSTLNQSTVMFFLLSYSMANLGAFIAIIAITNKINSDLIADFSGMSKRAPVLALGLTLCLISLIGMPPAAGFMAKFYIFSGAVQSDLLWLVIIAVINSVISAFYYLRVVKVMWLGEPASTEKVPSSGALRVALAITCLGVLFIGILPGFAMKAAEFAAKMFGG
ncbi:MAG: NADH-quinone oxidoreductase subunit N [Dehalococcoidales bacterium]|nr:NADH-quinone oxidoreductase subunit N [Dehalococcoidales bacterium]